LLTRPPTAEERTTYTAYLRDGYKLRIRSVTVRPSDVKKRLPESYVSWSNHLAPEATLVRQQQEAAARKGDPPTERLAPDWRARLEDLMWVTLNSPEFVFHH